MAEETSIDQEASEKFPVLKEAKIILETLFQILEINYQTKITSLAPFQNHLLIKQAQISQLLDDILLVTEKIANEKTFIQYREIGTIFEEIPTLLSSLQALFPGNLAEFYRTSHRLLKFYWAIHFFLARFELESIPAYWENQVLFFNFPDALFSFLQELPAGPQPIEILREIDLEIRLDRRLSLLLSRSPDYISLSPLGEKLLEVHSISEMYYYYLYEFEEDVVGPWSNSV